MFQDKIIKRIPGTILAQSPRERQGYLDLKIKTKVELLELLERQNKLLANKSFISKLPDKGAKIALFQVHLETLLSERDKISETCDLLSNLNLNSAKNVTEEIEWTGEYSGSQNGKERLDSDDDSDDEMDPIRILATQSGIGNYKKQHRVIAPVENLIKPEDIKDIESFKSCGVSATNVSKENRISMPEVRSSLPSEPQSITAVLRSSEAPSSDPYIQTLCDKLERPREKQREAFKPYWTTRSGVHSPSHVPKPKGPHWEITAATPPPAVHGDTKVISLGESLQLQKEQATKLKDIQTRHASEKLSAQLGLKMGAGLCDPTLLKQYRQKGPDYSSSSSEDEEEKEHSQGEEEEEEHEKDGAVIYNITD